MSSRFLYPLIPLACLISCSVGPSYHPPSIEVPSEWKIKQDETCNEYETNEEGELLYLDHWWQVFDDAKLEELEDLAIKNNRDLFIAYERVQEANALKGIAAANFYPQITLNPLFTNTVELFKNYIAPGGTSDKNCKKTHGRSNNNTALTTPFRIHEVLYSLPVNLSYEVDLWGKIRDQYQFSLYNWLAKQKGYETMMLSLTSSLAVAYYQLRTADAQMDLLLKILQTRQKAFEINKARYEEGVAFYADVTLAAEEVDIALNQYEEIQRQRNLLEDFIAVLIGIPASEFFLESMPLNGLPPCIPRGIPSDVLLRRPDIAEAENTIKSEHALVKEAYSQFFPSLTLTAAGGFESPVLKDFLKWISRYWSDGVQINQLIFDGGRTSYQLKLQIARFREAGGSYQQQVLVAFKEVEDALSNINSYVQQYEISLATTEWAQQTYQLYLDRYQLGVSYYINVANTERDQLNYELNSAALQGYQYIATIQLIKALGGGWSEGE